MEGFVSPVLEDSTADPIRIHESLGVYRRDDGNRHVHLRTHAGDIDLGFHDISVSGLRSDGAPVQFSEENGGVYVRNVDNASEVELQYLRTTEVLGRGEEAKISRDCVVEVGINTELLVTLEAKAETTEGVPLPVLVKSRCKTLEISARSSNHETIMHAEALLSVLEEYPVDSDRYETLVSDLEKRIRILKASESREKGGKLGTERREKIERLTSNIIDLYDLQG